MGGARVRLTLHRHAIAFLAGFLSQRNPELSVDIEEAAEGPPGSPQWERWESGAPMIEVELPRDRWLTAYRILKANIPDSTVQALMPWSQLMTTLGDALRGEAS